MLRQRDRNGEKHKTEDRETETWRYTDIYRETERDTDRDTER